MPQAVTNAPAGKSGRAAALPPAERRAAIIAATRPLLVEHGETVTTRQIADAAGIAEGTIFRVFRDKEELLAATLDAELDTTPFEAAVSAIDPDLQLEEKLAEATRLMQRRFVDAWKLVSNLGPELQRQAARRHHGSVALTELFEAHRDEIRIEAEEGARLLRALTMSLTHPMLAGKPKSPAEVVDLLLHGIEGDR